MQKKLEHLEQEIQDLKIQMNAVTKAAVAPVATSGAVVSTQASPPTPPEKPEKSGGVIEYVANRLDFNLFSPSSVGLK
jgi:hypothetical protein